MTEKSCSTWSKVNWKNKSVLPVVLLQRKAERLSNMHIRKGETTRIKALQSRKIVIANQAFTKVIYSLN